MKIRRLLVVDDDPTVAVGLEELLWHEVACTSWQRALRRQPQWKRSIPTPSCWTYDLQELISQLSRSDARAADDS